MTDRGKPKAGFPRSLENAGAFPTFPPHDHYDSPSTKGTNLRRYKRENRFYLTQAGHLGHNRFTGVASLRARYRHRPESLSTSRRNALSTSPEYASPCSARARKLPSDPGAGTLGSCPETKERHASPASSRTSAIRMWILRMAYLSVARPGTHVSEPRTKGLYTRTVFQGAIGQGYSATGQRRAASSRSTCRARAGGAA